MSNERWVLFEIPPLVLSFKLLAGGRDRELEETSEELHYKILAFPPSVDRDQGRSSLGRRQQERDNIIHLVERVGNRVAEVIQREKVTRTTGIKKADT
ncbi:uncharacterized protein EI97DRAFT_20908 [Westerdykella ornata]|uniref:Uncharacterized protein n=1 Tax=Westerdykella ornata TaxID=318751 RepID=A0A6A6JWZ2_WESOR|nr:uncharacterized protein EI97DRAFT_20908 [Westerdykella ornata]KAF2281132.1 hypothetical protein EI97DRAFT_20908 [Westerdykella ornata]